MQALKKIWRSSIFLMELFILKYVRLLIMDIKNLEKKNSSFMYLHIYL